MDIDLLSKIVKEIILDKDEVSLPGVGSFVAEIVPSVFSDKGYTINPPYKRLYFKQRENPDDNSIVELYASSNNLDKEIASGIIQDFLKELRKILEVKKTIIFPGLGKLRATKENYFFFVADENLDIYPKGFGLEPISLKTHEETPSEVSMTMATLKSILSPEEDNEANIPETVETRDSETVEYMESLANDETPDSEQEVTNKTNTEEKNIVETVQYKPEENDSIDTNTTVDSHATAGTTESTNIKDAEEAKNTESVKETIEVNTLSTPIEPTEAKEVAVTETTTQPTLATKRKSIWKITRWIIIALVALAITALAAFVILAHTAPDFIDSILYTPEELEIINM